MPMVTGPVQFTKPGIFEADMHDSALRELLPGFAAFFHSDSLRDATVGSIIVRFVNFARECSGSRADAADSGFENRSPAVTKVRPMYDLEDAGEMSKEGMDVRYVPCSPLLPCTPSTWRR